MLRKDYHKVRKTFKKHRQELKEAIDRDETGKGFVCEMFRYELENHEYAYTLNPTDAVEALHLSLDKVITNKKLYTGLTTACDLIMAEAWC